MSDRVPLTSADLAAALAERVDSPEWRARLASIARGDDDRALHVAVLREPFLGLMLSGDRTLESRFSRNRIAPYRGIRPGDVIAYKAASGPVLGVATVEDASFHELGEPDDHAGLRARFAEPLFAEDDAFWDDRRHARYATLVSVGPPERVAPTDLAKSDRRAWVTLER